MTCYSHLTLDLLQPFDLLTPPCLPARYLGGYVTAQLQRKLLPGEAGSHASSAAVSEARHAGAAHLHLLQQQQAVAARPGARMAPPPEVACEVEVYEVKLAGLHGPGLVRLEVEEGGVLGEVRTVLVEEDLVVDELDSWMSVCRCGARL